MKAKQYFFIMKGDKKTIREKISPADICTIDKNVLIIECISPLGREINKRFKKI